MHDSSPPPQRPVVEKFTGTATVSVRPKPPRERPHLVETNILCLLAEALTAQVEAVLADETGTVGADAAATRLVLPCLLVSVGAFVPAASALAVAARARVPNALVRHVCEDSTGGLSRLGWQWKVR